MTKTKKTTLAPNIFPGEYRFVPAATDSPTGASTCSSTLWTPSTPATNVVK